MTLNDKEIQELQGMVKKELGATEGTVFQIPNQDKYYQIVHSVDMTTQAWLLFQLMIGRDIIPIFKKLQL